MFSNNSREYESKTLKKTIKYLTITAAIMYGTVASCAIYESYTHRNDKKQNTEIHKDFTPKNIFQ